MGSECASLRYRNIGELSKNPPQRGSQGFKKNPQQQQLAKIDIRYTNNNKKPEVRQSAQKRLFQHNRVSNGKSAFNVSNYRESKNTINGTTSRYTVSSGENICHLYSNPDDQRQGQEQICDMIMQENLPDQVEQVIQLRRFNLQTLDLTTTSNSRNINAKKGYNSFQQGRDQTFHNRLTK